MKEKSLFNHLVAEEGAERKPVVSKLAEKYGDRETIGRYSVKELQ